MPKGASPSTNEQASVLRTKSPVKPTQDPSSDSSDKAWVHVPASKDQQSTGSTAANTTTAAKTITAELTKPSSAMSDSKSVPKAQSAAKLSLIAKPEPATTSSVDSANNTLNSDSDRVKAFTAKSRRTYRIIDDVYNYNVTFEEAAKAHNISMEQLGVDLAVFAMQSMQSLRAKGMFNETIFLAQGLNQEGEGPPMSSALDTARAKKGADARERHIYEGAPITSAAARPLTGQRNRVTQGRHGAQKNVRIGVGRGTGNLAIPLPKLPPMKK